MALLGVEGREIPGAYKPGSGTILQVNKNTAYISPDQKEYGRTVYVPGGLADKSCAYKLTTKYKIGDRVVFTYVKAAKPEMGCNWAAINLMKEGQQASSSTKVAQSGDDFPMCLVLGDKGRAIPGAYQEGTGVITYICSTVAYIKPDQLGYGHEVYVHGGLGDKSCQFKLNTKYKKGDRVKFTYVKAGRPELGCKWAAIDMEKITDAGTSRSATRVVQLPTISEDTNGSNGNASRVSAPIERRPHYLGLDQVIRGATGEIVYNGVKFAFIDLKTPVIGRAFMDNKSVNGIFVDENGRFSLLNAFPVTARVTCDLYQQEERHSCKFYAKNVVAIIQSDKPKPENLSSASKPETGIVSAEPKVDRDDVQNSTINDSSSAYKSPIPQQGSTLRSILMDATQIVPWPALPPFPPLPSFKVLDTGASKGDTARTDETVDSLPARHTRAHTLTTSKISASNGTDRIGDPFSAALSLLKPPYKDGVTQTEPTVESSLLNQIFKDGDLSKLICDKRPDIMYRYNRYLQTRSRPVDK